ncbi:hypothetical protein HAX54_038949 [Datura stramonium]|uniref:Uncharacterized protein n=1 Tax=Datura stramonium TaxID=4076 RepID=A0ABS8VNX2_DATST|nr:hypothetical protein [Datura stramonium]
MHDDEMAYMYSTFDVERTPYDYDQDSCFHPLCIMATGSPIHNIMEIKNQEKEVATLKNMAKMSNEGNPSIYCLAFTTRSGKVLHSEPCMAIEEEKYDGEKLGPNVDVAPREVNDENSSEEVNEELKVEAPLPSTKPPIPKPSTEEPPKSQLKPLPSYLCYKFLGL